MFNTAVDLFAKMNYNVHEIFHTYGGNSLLYRRIQEMSELHVSEQGNILDPNHLSFNERAIELQRIEAMEAERREREKHSPYRNWYQFNLEHSKDMIWLAKNAPKAHLILLFLLEQMDGYNAVMCSYQVFCEALGMGRTTASQAVKLLKDKGFIAVLKSGSSNVYVVNKDLAWKSWGKNQKYCKFPANVIITASENADIEVEADKIKTVSLKEASIS